MNIPKGYEIVNDVPEGYEVVSDAPATLGEQFNSGAKTMGDPQPIQGVSTEDTPYLQPQKPYGKAFKEGVRSGLPIAAGFVGGMVPGFGVVTGPVAGAATDYALSKAYGEEAGEGDLENRGMSLGVDVAAGLAFPAGKQLARGAKAVVGALKRTPIDQKITSTVRYGIEKGIRPTVVGKQNFAQSKAYYEKAESAVRSIIDNKGNLQYIDDAGNLTTGLPKSLKEFSHAIDSTKRSIFSKYDDIILNTHGNRSVVDLTDITNELQKFSSDKVNRMFGNGADYAEKQFAEMSGQKLTLMEAQDALTAINRRLEAFYKNPNPDRIGTTAVDAMIANRLRKSIDDAVSNQGYAELKKQYGALKAIEKEVSNRAVVDARKNVKGLLDFADIASAAEAARAVAYMSPESGLVAVTIKTMKEIYKKMNDPNRIVQKMFIDVDKLASKAAKP